MNEGQIPENPRKINYTHERTRIIKLKDFEIEKIKIQRDKDIKEAEDKLKKWIVANPRNSLGKDMTRQSEKHITSIRDIAENNIRTLETMARTDIEMLENN